MQTTQIFSRIKQEHNQNQIYLIGIDGLGGAGKSTVSEKLLIQLQDAGIPVTLLHIDDFIHPKAIRYNPNYPEWECYYHLQWRYDYLCKQILQPLRRVGALDTLIERYQLDQDSYTHSSLHIPAGSIVILEGVFLQRQELAGIFDLMVYVDVPEAIRLQRVLERDGYIGDKDAIAAKYAHRYFPAEHHYIAEYAPSEHADIVLS